MRRTPAVRSSRQLGRRIVLAGARFGPPDLNSQLRTCFGDALWATDDFASVVRGDDKSPSDDRRRSIALAVGVCPVAERDAHRRFVCDARRRRVPALSVAFEDDVALIGPLGLPTRAGCGHCARLRMIAANAAMAVPSTSAAPPIPRHPVGVERLATEIRSFLRDTRKASRLGQHVLAVDRDAAVTLHRFIPMPYCDVCGGAGLVAEPAAEGLDGWVGRRTGVIATLAIEPPSATGVTSPIVVTTAPPHVVTPDGTIRRLPLGWGKGLTPVEAVLSAVGEAIERYAPSLPDSSRWVVARPADLDGAYLNPASFALYDDAQYARTGFPFARYDPTRQHPWVRGWWLGTNEAVWVHVVLVYLSFEVQRHQLICQGSSNGLAASTSLDDASMRATRELVERDALLHAWLTATPGHQLIIDDSIDPRLRAIIQDVEAHGAAVEVYVLDTSVCGTTAMCLSLGDGRGWPGVTLALGADLDPLTAIRHAILELGQTGPHLRRLLRSAAGHVPSTPAGVREMLDHATYYFPVERRHAFDRLRFGGHRIRLRDLAVRDRRPGTSWRAALDHAGVRVAVVDVTSPDVRLGPFRVVRAVSPELQGLSYGFGLDRQPVLRIKPRLVETPPVHPIW